MSLSAFRQLSLRPLAFIAWLFLICIIPPVFAEPQKREIPLLVSPEWLEENLKHDNIVIVDFRRCRLSYLVSHIPGAFYIERSSVYDTVDDTTGMLPPPEIAIPHFEEAGISNDSIVIVYDSSGGLWASRLFWALEYFGHEDVHILDGGFPNWVRAGRPVSTTRPEPAKGLFRYTIRPELLADSMYVKRNLDNDQVQVIDTRSAAEYAGIDIRTRRAGHLPGAVHIEWKQNLGKSNRFLSMLELEETYDSENIDKSKTQVTYCLAGVRAAHTYFVLRSLGYENVKLFDESWIVWGNLPDTPIE